MIFEVNANQIERLNEGQLVAILQRLIHAELNKNSIPLRSGTAPAQLNIPDGGDDGRVSWSGGVNETDWLPSRFTIFQSKKGSMSPSLFKAETQTKSSQKTDKPQLNEALIEALHHSGAYVIVTGAPVVGTNIDRRIIAIREGIQETGNDPSLLSSIEIYDCNKLAAWTNTHPSVALWLNALLRDVHLSSFQTFEDWGRAPEITEIEFQDCDDKRFVAKGIEVKTWQNQDATIFLEKSFNEIREVISTFYSSRGNAIRIIGPSGYGKTRLVHQLISSQISSPQDVLDKSQIVYCTYEEVKDRLLNIARDIVNTSSRSLLIVDDCPDEIHARLSEIVNHEGSHCHLLTIGVETNSIGLRRNLIVELNAASSELIDLIAEATNKEIGSRNASLIRELSQGFPRMAVYASRALEHGDEELSSVETLITRILWGEHKEDPSAFESLQLLSFFTIVGMENDSAHELDEIASYCGKNTQNMYRELSRFSSRGVLLRQGDYGEIQPLPLAMRLSNLWLESMPVGTLETLFRSLSEEMKLRMVGRLRWMSWSDKVTRFARALLYEALPDPKALNCEFGSKLLDRFAHIAPDATMEHLDNLLLSKSIDELAAFDSGRRYTILALEKLAFRRETFHSAARLLLKLGAAENENWSNNASGQFIELFQLYLSGTEAMPKEKLLVLDEGLAEADERVRKLCIDALDRMLNSDHFSRSGGREHIGAGEALEDWQPKTHIEILNYYCASLTRLEQIALTVDDPNSLIALNIISSHLRGLFSIEPMLDDIQEMVTRLRETHPWWNNVALKVNEWLYFDRNDATEEHRQRLRAYYDELLPTDTVGLIYYYSCGWEGDINDPDVCYELNGDTNYQYGSNQIVELIDKSPNESTYFVTLIDELMATPTNLGRRAMIRIAKHVDDPENIVKYLIKSGIGDGDIFVLSDLLRNVILGAAKADRDKGLMCMDLALSEQNLSSSSIDFVSAVGLDNVLMRYVIECVKNNKVKPHQVLIFAFNDILQTIDHTLIAELVNTLLTKQELGAWAAVTFSSQILHGSVPEDEWLIKSIKRSVANPALFEKSQYSNMDWFYWHNLVEKLLDGNHCDDDFNLQLIDFIISVTAVEEFGVQLAFGDFARKILRRLISTSSRLIWEKHLEIRDVSKGRVKFRLENLFMMGIGRSSTPGVLCDIPKDIYIPWMLEDKNERMQFVLEWIQLFSKTENEHNWTADFVSFIDSYVEQPDEINVLLSRLTSGVWCGSFADKLEREFNQLLQLREISINLNVQRWINRTLLRMEQQIIDQRRQDANREASYRA
jgi:hypothetical protein